MVFGSVPKERIALNEATVWSGSPNASNVNPATREYLPEMRRLLFEGKYAEGNELARTYLGGREDSYGTHLPLGNLWIDQIGAEDSRSYKRWLDLEQAVAGVIHGGVSREIFVSSPADVMAIRIATTDASPLSLNISLDSGDLPGESFTTSANTIFLVGSAWEKKHSSGNNGVNFAVLASAIVEGGRFSSHAGIIEIRAARVVTVLVSANTDYHGADYFDLCKRQVENGVKQGYKALRDHHVIDHRRLFERVDIDLGKGPGADQATDERLAAYGRGSPDPDLEALFFQYGRYLLIAGSRENSPLPMNLQGIWNDNLAANMGWRCDFHLDINTQQNYWPIEVCNLSDCGEPLFKLVESIAKHGRDTAREMYGVNGWVCHVYTNAWGFTAAGVGLEWGPFVTGGVWAAWHLWEHFRYTGDKRFLADRAYPVLRGAAEFFLDYMVPEPEHGWLVTGPSLSPENQFLSPDRRPCSVSMGPTCDRELIYALFASCIASSKILGVDGEFRGKLIAALDKLPPLQIGRHGQLQEWLHDFEEAEPNHRHTSHLIGLYPLDEITPDNTPDLAKAARVTLTRRLGQKNWEDVEWSRANLINFYARLRDADAAYGHLAGLLKEDTDHNLLTFSRAGIAGAQENIFAIDGNTAATAGIAEMLMQSHHDLHLLPALPSAWPNGSIRGLRARGGFEVSLAWEAGKLTRVRISSEAGGGRAIRYANHVRAVHLESGGSIVLDSELKSVNG